MTLAIIMAGIALFISGATFVGVLVLLGRSEFQYATKRDFEELFGRLVVLGANQSKLYRYLEAVDDQGSGAGHRVLGSWVPEHDA